MRRLEPDRVRLLPDARGFSDKRSDKSYSEKLRGLVSTLLALFVRSSALIKMCLCSDDLQGATVGSKLACSFVDGGSMLFFQNRTSTDTIFASDVSRSGVSISNFAIP